jgi:hypothetical protein
MTGRGLALVAQLAGGWGVAPVADGGVGKVVWAELVPGSGGADEVQDQDDVDLDALLAAFSDEDDSELTYTVRLGAVPTELLLESKAIAENIVREFRLEAATARTAEQAGSTALIPAELADLLATVVHDFAAARGAMKRQALAAAQRGDREVQLVLTLPASAAQAGEQYLAALDEADRFARNARLLTLETLPVHKVFRRWYVQRLVDELRAAAAGSSAPPATTFAEALGEALTRVAPLEEQAARLEALQQVTADLTAAVTVEQIATTVARSATTVLGAHSAHVYLVDGDLFRSFADDGDYDPDVGARWGSFPISSDIPAGAALLSGETLAFRDRAELLRQFPSLADAFVNELSLLVAPLVIGDHRLGVLSATFGGAARIEERAQRLFLTTLADVTAQAIERAQASGAAAQANERLRFLAEASMLLSGTLDYRQVLGAIADLVVPRMADWCSIQLLEGDRLVPVAIAHVDEDKVRWAWELNERYPTDMSAPTGAPRSCGPASASCTPRSPRSSSRPLPSTRSTWRSSAARHAERTGGAADRPHRHARRHHDDHGGVGPAVRQRRRVARRGPRAPRRRGRRERGRLPGAERPAGHRHARGRGGAARDPVRTAGADRPGAAGRAVRQRRGRGPHRRRHVRGRAATRRRPAAHRRRPRQGTGGRAHRHRGARRVPLRRRRPRRPDRRRGADRPQAARLPGRRGLRHRSRRGGRRRRQLVPGVLRPSGSADRQRLGRRAGGRDADRAARPGRAAGAGARPARAR